MKNVFKVMLFLALILIVPSTAYADSPITSTEFYKAYTDVDIVKTAKQEGIMTFEIGTYLASPDMPVHVKAALINALGWDLNGKNNAEYYSYLIYSKPIKYLNLDNMSGEQLFCVGYLMAMDNYFDPSKALPILEKAAQKAQNSYTISLVHALVKAQQLVNSGDMSTAWKLVEDVQNNKELEVDMRPEARKIIFDYMSTYGKYSNSLTITPSIITLASDKTATAEIRGGAAPYSIIAGCSEAGLKIEGSTLSVTGIRPGSVQITISDGDGKTVTVPVTITQSESTKKLNGAIALYLDSHYAYANNVCSLIDPENPALTPVIRNDYALVPVRFIAENFNAAVSWDSVTSTATLVSGNNTIKLTIGSTSMKVNGNDVQLPVPAESIEGKAFLPLRAYAEALGKKIFYDRKLIIISDTENLIDKTKEAAIVDEIITLFDISETGNTSGNIINNGIAAKQGNWIFFSNSNDSGRLYRMKIDGSAKACICEDSAAFINVLGNWIYYSSPSNKDNIYKIKTDGTEKTLICDDKAGFLNITGGWIYYQSYSGSNKIFRVKTDGTEKGIISDDNVEYLNVSGDYLYYSNTSDQYRIYRIKLDGSDRKCISEDSGWFINVSGDYVYYCNSSDSDKLYRIKTDGSEKTLISNDKSWYINISGEWIYYNNYFSGLYKAKIDGSERTRVCADKAKSINITGNIILYEYMADDGKTTLYKIGIDGNGKMRID